jgi:ubiquinone biosynthesis protein COQ4
MFLKFRLMKAYFMLAKDPSNTDLVFKLSDLLLKIAGPKGILKIEQEMSLVYPITYSQYLAKKEISGIDYKPFEVLPKDTLGNLYYRHMTDNVLSVDFFDYCDKDNFVDYLRNKIRATHDVWHALTGCGTSWDQEVGLQAFYAGQKATALNTILVSVGYLHIALTGKYKIFNSLTKTISDNNQSGLGAKNILEHSFDSFWDKNIEEVRQELGLTPKTC